ncbi:hypothetical protein ISS30_02585 [bacterium]|nr:hypothetical protein [FCB group bacterium]MBL7190556.1 hypothetical protein [bacterium]
MRSEIRQEEKRSQFISDGPLSKAQEVFVVQFGLAEPKKSVIPEELKSLPDKSDEESLDLIKNRRLN